VVESRQISASLVAYRIVCCGESCDAARCADGMHSCEDSWHVLGAADEEHEDKLKLRKQEIAARHEAMVQWRKKNA
jgi:hypothetical protein